MPKGLFVAVAAAWLIASASTAARADWCETFPGSQQYTDQGCGKPNADSGGAQPGAAPTQPRPTSLREQLRRALSSGRTGKTSPKTSPAALANSVASARDGVTRALGEAAMASDPQQAAKARRDYNAALARLDRAYDAAANAASPQGRAELLDMKSRDDANFASAAGRVGLSAAAPAQPAPAAAASQPPAHIAAAKGLVYVCDKAIAGGNNVSCREISADGSQCTNVTLADGDIGWRDSIATPCRGDDLAQRQAFLAAHPDVAAAVNGTQAPFAMDSAGTAAEIARLTAEPVDPEAEKALAAMSPECRAILQNYIAAAQANDGPGATAQYAAMKQAGGCGVLQWVAPKPAGDPRFISRGDTPMLDQTFGACDQQPDLCTRIADQLKAGTSSEAVATMYNNAIGIGLRLGSMMGGAILNAQAARMPKGGAAPPAPRSARAPAPHGARMSGPPANYPARAPLPSRGNDCTMDANNWLTCK